MLIPRSPRAESQFLYLLPVEEFVEVRIDYMLNLDFPIVICQPESLRTMLRRMSARALQIAGDDGEA